MSGAPDSLRLNWIPPGPVAGAFMTASSSIVYMLQGPIGGGKTSASFMKAVRLARLQRPSTVDGIKKFKLCVVHQTYRQLWRATIPSWWEWVPQSVGQWTGSKDGPASHVINFIDGNYQIRLTLEFVAIGDQSAEDVLRGYQPTAFLLNEADLLNKDVYTYARGRAGRYPRMDEGGPSWYGLLMDFNAPVIGTWLYDLIENLPADHAYFRQPGAFDPGAENRQNLPEGYYENQMSGQDAMYLRRMIHNKFGFRRDGMPVYGDDYSDDLHCAATDLAPVKGLPIHLGADAGRTPSGLVGQRLPNGQWRILDELVCVNMGAKAFGRAFNRLLEERYKGFEIASAFGDPAASFAGDADEFSWLQIVAQVMKLRWRPAPVINNSLTARLEVVRQGLQNNTDGQPNLVISPRCRDLRRGFNSDYRYKKLQVSGSERYEESPEKNNASHPHDALQYLLLGGGEYNAVMGRAQAAESASGRQMTARTESNPAGEFRGGGRRGRQTVART